MAAVSSGFKLSEVSDDLGCATAIRQAQCLRQRYRKVFRLFFLGHLFPRYASYSKKISDLAKRSSHFQGRNTLPSGKHWPPVQIFFE